MTTTEIPPFVSTHIDISGQSVTDGVIPFADHDLTNKGDIFDLVIDGYCTHDQLQIIAGRLYEDNRGGPLVDLYSNDEFMTALERQLGVAA